MSEVPEYLKEQYSDVTEHVSEWLKPGEQLFMCNDCGANGTVPDEIKHKGNCTPGECAKWQKVYSKSEG